MARYEDVNTVKYRNPRSPASAPNFPPTVDDSSSRGERRRYRTTANHPPPSIQIGNNALTTGSIEPIAISNPAVLAEGSACLQFMDELGTCGCASGATSSELPEAEGEIAASGTRTCGAP